MPWSRLVADLIVVLYAAYVSFVIFGLIAIVFGLLFRRRWARNFWFRVVHLSMILIVLTEALAGIPCPLTIWEHTLRTHAGQQTYSGDFLGHWAHRLIFFDASPWVFTLGYGLFGSIALLTFLLGPPRLTISFRRPCFSSKPR